jgi:hypothetical protein
MRYTELKYGNKTYTIKSQIEKILENKKFYWLLDSEIENAVLEIKKDTLIWHDGDFLSGNWYYGIFKKGSFNGIWENGIFENGSFDGKWLSGINLLTHQA